MSRTLSLALLSLALACTSACDRAAEPSKTTPATKPSAAAPTAAPAASLSDSYFLAAAPANPQSVKTSKASLKAGDKVTFIGRIGGSEEPFVAKRAIFTLVDSALKTCDEGSEMDACKTPWDYCCDPREVITENSAVIQVVGADGQPLKVELNGARGLKPKATVSVVGTVAKAEAGNIVINASGLFVHP